jgi:Tol biopolymer transport system component
VPGFDRPLTTGQARFSPDGRLIAFVEKAISGRLWLFDIERKTHRALSHDGVAGNPLWSPDGRRLVVDWSAAGPRSLWSVPVEAGGSWERLTDADESDIPSSWSPDGRVLAFVRARHGGHDICLYGFEDRQVVPFLATGASERSPAFSPDGRRLAYTSDESGRAEVYVTSFPDRKRVLVVSTRGGMEAAWSRDGTELFYRSLGPSAEASVMSVAVKRGETIALGRATRLFPSDPYGAYDRASGYDVTPDGRRFLFVRAKKREAPEPPPPITRLHLVHNWFAELERLSPTRRPPAAQETAK